MTLKRNSVAWLSVGLAGLCSHFIASAAPLTIYNGSNKTGTSAGCQVDVAYIGSAIPKSLNNKTTSFFLEKGYGVVMGINNDCVGASKFYRAEDSNRTVNLPSVLNNKVSFIRVMKLDTTVKKKGLGGTGAPYALADALKCGWYYNWGSGGSATSSLDYTPMKWGGGNSAGNITFAEGMQNEPYSNLLAFNEPDGSDQANITVATALDRYEEILRSGLRMGSPVVKQDGFNGWLSPFMDQATSRGLRVDFLAAHWYDWGNENTSSTGQQISNRMQAKLLTLRNTCGPTLSMWVTEYNANKNRTSSQIHANFINASSNYFSSTSWIERHAYFRARWANAAQTITSGAWFGEAGSLTTSGQAFRDSTNGDSKYREYTNNLGI